MPSARELPRRVTAWVRGYARTRRRVDRPVVYGRNPFEVFLLALSVPASIPLLFGKVSSQALEDTLPPWATLLWGAFLLFGSVTALVGLFWLGQFTTALAIKRTGLILVAAAAYIFAVAAISAAGYAAARYSVNIQLAYGTACLVRVWQTLRPLATVRMIP